MALHPSDLEIKGYCKRSLPVEQKIAFLQHIDVCELCRKKIAEQLGDKSRTWEVANEIDTLLSENRDAVSPSNQEEVSYSINPSEPPIEHQQALTHIENLIYLARKIKADNLEIINKVSLLPSGRLEKSELVAQAVINNQIEEIFRTDISVDNYKRLLKVLRLLANLPQDAKKHGIDMGLIEVTLKADNGKTELIKIDCEFEPIKNVGSTVKMDFAYQ